MVLGKSRSIAHRTPHPRSSVTWSSEFRKAFKPELRFEASTKIRKLEKVADYERDENRSVSRFDIKDSKE